MDINTIVVINNRAFREKDILAFFKPFGRFSYSKGFVTFDSENSVKKVFQVENPSIKNDPLVLQIRTGKLIQKKQHESFFLECDTKAVTDYDLIHYFNQRGIQIVYQKNQKGFFFKTNAIKEIKIYIKEIKKEKGLDSGKKKLQIKKIISNPKSLIVDQFLEKELNKETRTKAGKLEKKISEYFVFLEEKAIGKIRGKDGAQLKRLETNFNCSVELLYFVYSFSQDELSFLLKKMKVSNKSNPFKYMFFAKIDWKNYLNFFSDFRRIKGETRKFCVLKVNFKKPIQDNSRLFRMLFFLTNERHAFFKNIVEGYHYSKIFNSYAISQSHNICKFREYEKIRPEMFKKFDKYYYLSSSRYEKVFPNLEIDVDDRKWKTDNRELYLTQYKTYLLEENIIPDFIDAWKTIEKSINKKKQLYVDIMVGKSLYGGSFFEGTKEKEVTRKVEEFIGKKKQKNSLEFTFYPFLTNEESEKIVERLTENQKTSTKEQEYVSIYLVDKEKEERFKLYFSFEQESKKLKFLEMKKKNRLNCMNFRLFSSSYDIRCVLKETEQINPDKMQRKLISLIESNKFNVENKMKINSFKSPRYEFLVDLNNHLKKKNVMITNRDFEIQNSCLTESETSNTLKFKLKSYQKIEDFLGTLKKVVEK